MLFGALTVSAGTIETLDHQAYEGTIRWNEGTKLSIQTSNGATHQISLDQLRYASLKPAPEVAGRLPRGWSAEDIDQVQGNSGEQNGVYTLRVRGGQGKDVKRQAAHYAYRVLRGDGEVVARVTSVRGSNGCLAGVMMRENLEPPGGFVWLAVGAEGTLHLDVRDYGWHALQRRDLGAVKLPVWLKLVRHEKDKRVTAWRSANGTNWQEVGQSPMGCKLEPFPDDSDHWRPKLCAGLAIRGASTENLASARFDHVALTAYGLLGEYFADDRFHRFVFSRPDEKIQFNWGDNSPTAEIEPDHFAVRWTGKLEPKFTEAYRFLLDADNDAWLWLDGKEVKTAKFNRERDAELVPLVAGQRYELKLEFKEGAGAASVRLGWSSHRQFAEVIPASQLTYTYGPDSPNEEATESATNTLCTKGIWLRGGSLIAGAIQSADKTALHLAFGGQPDFSILNSQVARVIFHRPRRASWLENVNSQAGVLLKTGDLLEGEFVKMDRGALTIQSVLFGQRKFSLDNGELVALLLRPMGKAPATFKLRLVSGSVLRINRLRAEGDTLHVEDTSLGEVAISQQVIAEIERITTSEPSALMDAQAPGKQ